MRADAQRTGFIDLRDRASARANLEYIDHGNLDRQRAFVAADQRSAGRQHVSIVNNARLGGRAAHVERNRMRNAEFAAQRFRADYPGGRA